MKKNDGFTLIELLVTLVIVGVIMTFIISMMSSQYAIIRDVDAYLTISSENKDLSDRLIQAFITAEDIEVDLEDGNGYQSIMTNAGTADYFDSNGVSLFKTHIIYDDSNISEEVYISFKRDDTNTNELIMETYKSSNNTQVGSSISLGEHLSSSTDPTVTFYRRLSLDRRVVALTKVKINYYHDGITKQYDLFYHMRNLDYSN